MSENFSTSAFSSVFGGSYDTHQIGYDASRCGRITIPSAIEHGNRFIDECLYTNWIEGKRMHVGKEEGWMEYSFLLWEEFRPVSIRRSWICGYGTYLSSIQVFSEKPRMVRIMIQFTVEDGGMQDGFLGIQRNWKPMPMSFTTAKYTVCSV